jgi:hypothetical protein
MPHVPEREARERETDRGVPEHERVHSRCCFVLLALVVECHWEQRQSFQFVHRGHTTLLYTVQHDEQGDH